MIVLEGEDESSQHKSDHNGGVLHAGHHHTAGSLQAYGFLPKLEKADALVFSEVRRRVRNAASPGATLAGDREPPDDRVGLARTGWPEGHFAC